MSRPSTDLVVEACQILKHADAEKFAPVIDLLLAKEKDARDDAKPKRKRKVALYDQRRHKIEFFSDDLKRMEEK